MRRLPGGTGPACPGLALESRPRVHFFQLRDTGETPAVVGILLSAVGVSQGIHAKRGEDENDKAAQDGEVLQHQGIVPGKPPRTGHVDPTNLRQSGDARLDRIDAPASALSQ